MKQTLRGFNSTLGPKPFRGRVRKVAHETEGVFWLETIDGRRWLWPVNCMTEAQWDGTLEDWAFKSGGHHVVKSWHCVTPQTSDPGFFDRVYLLKDRAVFAELKVRYQNGVANGTSTGQKQFIAAGLGAGLDIRVWTFPDDAFDAWETLTGQPKEKCPYWAETRGPA